MEEIIVKSLRDQELNRAYQELKVCSRGCADKVWVEWWEAKVAEAERLYEIGLSQAHGGSLLKDLT